MPTLPLDCIIDLSHHNADPIDFAKARAAGFLAVILKATQGAGYVDPTYAARREAALAAGLLVGSYHFGDGTDPHTQAEHYLDTVGPHFGELLVLDFEKNPDGPSMTLADANYFVNEIAIDVVVPVLYAGSLLKDQLSSSATPGTELLACPLWLAQYGPNAILPKGWASWAMWQYSDGRVNAPPWQAPGIGICDRSKWGGTEDELRTFWGAHSATVPGA